MLIIIEGFPGGLDGKESTCNAGNLSSIPGLERLPGEGNGNPLQCSCLEKPMNRGAWRATVHGVSKSRTRLSDSARTHRRYWAPLYPRGGIRRGSAQAPPAPRTTTSPARPTLCPPPMPGLFPGKGTPSNSGAILPFDPSWRPVSPALPNLPLGQH